MGTYSPMGVFDSGIGGLTVVKELRSLLPQENIIYFGDTARTPYGSRPPAEILSFMQQILCFFSAQQVKLAVVACNTMTALGLEIARKRCSFPIVGVNLGIRSALAASKKKCIGVIATQATVACGKHGQVAHEFAPEATVYPQACPKFVPLIENEQLTGAAVEAAAREYLVPLKEAYVDALILGCTHYPFIRPVLERIMDIHTVIIDPAHDTAVDAGELLQKKQLLNNQQSGTVRFCFSADTDRARRMAAHLFAEQLPEFEIVNLQDYQ